MIELTSEELNLLLKLMTPSDFDRIMKRNIPKNKYHDFESDIKFWLSEYKPDIIDVPNTKVQREYISYAVKNDLPIPSSVTFGVCICKILNVKTIPRYVDGLTVRVYSYKN